MAKGDVWCNSMETLFRKLNKEIWAEAGNWVKPEKVDTIRSALLRLTHGGKCTRILAVAEEADCTIALVEFCYHAGLLVGYKWYTKGRPGFSRKLHLIVDNTR